MIRNCSVRRSICYFEICRWTRFAAPSGGPSYLWVFVGGEPPEGGAGFDTREGSATDGFRFVENGIGRVLVWYWKIRKRCSFPFAGSSFVVVDVCFQWLYFWRIQMRREGFGFFSIFHRTIELFLQLHRWGRDCWYPLVVGETGSFEGFQLLTRMFGVSDESHGRIFSIGTEIYNGDLFDFRNDVTHRAFLWEVAARKYKHTKATQMLSIKWTKMFEFIGIELRIMLLSLHLHDHKKIENIYKLQHKKRVLFENRPALYFCNYIFITAHKMYNFWFRIKDTVYFFYCQ